MRHLLLYVTPSVPQTGSNSEGHFDWSRHTQGSLPAGSYLHSRNGLHSLEAHLPTAAEYHSHVYIGLINYLLIE